MVSQREKAGKPLPPGPFEYGGKLDHLGQVQL